MNREKPIRDFWQEHPCGENLVKKEEDWAAFFHQYDRFRYATEGHILDELDLIDFADKKVLEIGVGQAADSLQIIKRGGRWFGLDLTEAAIHRAKMRFKLAGVEYDEVRQGSVLDIPYPDNSFDIVYSHGVLHHVPDIQKGSKEILRVLKPSGVLVVMLYHKNSLNYWVSICFLRRIMMVGLWLVALCGAGRFLSSETLKGHIDNVKEVGLLQYLRLPRFLWVNTDGPQNPYSKVYDCKEVQKDFPNFEIMEARCHFLNERHLPILKALPDGLRAWLEKRFGWHLWVFMRPRIKARKEK